MIRKKEKWEKARNLRLEDGLSLNEISSSLGVAKSTVSLWVRDIKLTDEQLFSLKRNELAGPHENGRKIKENFRLLRQKYQQDGREQAKKKEWLHSVGCMLYWAEGHKKNNRNAVRFANSDPAMIKLFVKFLTEFFRVDISKINFRIKCYLKNGIKLESIEKYWIKEIGLDPNCLKKSEVNRLPISSKEKRGHILPYGTCYISVNDTKIAQHIYGAIQEYAGIEGENWID